MATGGSMPACPRAGPTLAGVVEAVLTKNNRRPHRACCAIAGVAKAVRQKRQNQRGCQACSRLRTSSGAMSQATPMTTAAIRASTTSEPLRGTR